MDQVSLKIENNVDELRIWWERHHVFILGSFAHVLLYIVDLAWITKATGIKVLKPRSQLVYEPAMLRDSQLCVCPMKVWK